MNSLELKSDLHNLIDNVNDINILNAIKVLINERVSESDFWDKLPLNVQKSILKGKEQAEKGEIKSHEEVMEKYEKWL
jgi:predicted transcriptional regulator